MPKHVHVLISYRGLKRPLNATQKYTDVNQQRQPRGMTTIWRANFWDVFSTVHEFRFSRQTVAFYDLSGILEKIYVIEGPPEKLNQTERSTYIVYFSIEIESDPDDRYFLHQDRFDGFGGTSDPREAVLLQTPCAHLVEDLGADVRGHSIVVSELLDDVEIQAAPYVCSFYYYAWVLLLRIERYQREIPLSVEASPRSVVYQKIVDQRIRMINVQRYFLTTDRTNVDAIKRLILMLILKYNLEERVERLSRSHTAFEQYLDSTSKIDQARRTVTLSNIVLILTVCSVPLAAMTLLLSINLSGSIFTEANDVVHSTTTYIIFGVGVLFAIIPIAIMKIYEWIRRRGE